MTMQQPSFNRGLSPSFLDELVRGKFKNLVATVAASQMDLQIRDDYVNLYHNGLSLLRLSNRTERCDYRAHVHWKYLQGVDLPGGHATGNYCQFDASDGFVDRYLAGLPQIRQNSEAHAKPEGSAEQDIVIRNHDDLAAVVVIDRQIQVPGIRRRADLMGLTVSVDGQMSFVLIELKRGLDNRIQDLTDQMGDYHQALAGEAHALRPDIQKAYRNVVRQKQALGLLPKSIQIPDEPLAVICLLALYDYNHKSELLDRLRQTAAQGVFNQWLVILPESQFCLPPRHCWEPLRCQRESS